MKCYYVTPIRTTYDRDTMVSPVVVGAPCSGPPAARGVGRIMSNEKNSSLETGTFLPPYDGVCRQNDDDQHSGDGNVFPL